MNFVIFPYPKHNTVNSFNKVQCSRAYYEYSNTSHSGDTKDQ